MNANLKNLLEKISADEALRAKFDPLAKMEDRRAADEALVALAAEIDMPLTEADLVPEEELDLDELDAVAGGSKCACVLGGGGKEEAGYSEYGWKDELCWCVAAGEGTAAAAGIDVTFVRCVCPFAGGGDSRQRG